MAQENDNVQVASYKYFESLTVGNGAIAGYICPESDGDSTAYIAFVLAPEGIAVNSPSFSNPPATVMRETVEVMRELVARFDTISGDLDNEDETTVIDYLRSAFTFLKAMAGTTDLESIDSDRREATEDIALALRKLGADPYEKNGGAK